MSGSDPSPHLCVCLAVKYSMQVLFNSSNDQFSRFPVGDLALVEVKRTACALCCISVALET
jgi:hypothetical protein